MQPEINTNNITYSIIRVKELFFFVNEALFIPDPTKSVKIELYHNLQISDDETKINFVLGVILHYAHLPADLKLAEIQVQNLFHVNGLNSLKDNEGGFLLPNNLLVSIISMSISHARALFSKSLAGTYFQEIVLPITNPVEVAKHFFKIDEKNIQTFIPNPELEKKS